MEDHEVLDVDGVVDVDVLRAKPGRYPTELFSLIVELGSDTIKSGVSGVKIRKYAAEG